VTGVLDYLARLLGGFAFWVVVLPWQQGLRVRAGRYVRLLEGGLYLKLPVLDVVKVESVRRRNSMLPVQTLTTADGATVTVAGIVAYAIGDLELLFRTLHHAEDTIIQSAGGAIADQVLRQKRCDLDPAVLGAIVSRQLADAFAPYGLIDVSMQVTDFAVVRALRLISDQRWSHGGVLDTQDSSGARA
jgi:regulator of protease activity HflC (stomatin/prohibitin superfamily)